MTPSPRIPLLAAALSILMPGLGQLYCGRLARAIAILSISCLAILLLGRVLNFGNFAVTLTYEFAIGSLISILATIDAWIIARRTPNDYLPDERNRPATYTWFIVLGLLVSVTVATLEARRIQEHLRTFRMVGKSMNPTLLEGDVFFVDHRPFDTSEPVAGELVVYRSPLKRTQHWTSRIIALPGQTVEVRNGELLVDGTSVREGGKPDRESQNQISYAVSGMEKIDDIAAITVPDYHVFLMSDNRANAVDSRKFGPIAITSLEGRIQNIYWPYSRRGDPNIPN